MSTKKPLAVGDRVKTRDGVVCTVEQVSSAHTGVLLKAEPDQDRYISAWYAASTVTRVRSSKDAE